MKSVKYEIELNWIENNGMYSVWAWDPEAKRHVATMHVYENDSEYDKKLKASVFMEMLLSERPF